MGRGGPEHGALLMSRLLSHSGPGLVNFLSSSELGKRQGCVLDSIIKAEVQLSSMLSTLLWDKMSVTKVDLHEFRTWFYGSWCGG